MARQGNLLLVLVILLVSGFTRQPASVQAASEGAQAAGAAGHQGIQVDQPKVCIVVRTYWGHGKVYGDNSLARLLQSLQSQTHTRCELPSEVPALAGRSPPSSAAHGGGWEEPVNISMLACPCCAVLCAGGPSHFAMQPPRTLFLHAGGRLCWW